MATLTFIPTGTTAAGRDWNVARNWSGTIVPTGADTAVVAQPFATGPIISGGTTDTVGGVTLEAAGTTQSNIFVGAADYIGISGLAGAGTLNVTGPVTDTGG